MTMKKIVITTVGTSLIDNLKVKVDKSLYTTSDKAANVADVKTEFEKTMTLLFNEKSETDNTICAELQTIAKIRKTYADVEMYLICTDTILSPICANFIQQRLGDSAKEPIIIKGLVVDGKEASKTFEEEGFPNLIREIKEIEKQASEDNRPILNISGGYKALIPVLTIMGQLYNMELNYIYEDAEDLLRISKLPVNFDWTLVSYFGIYLTSKKHETRKLNSNEQELLNELVEIDVFRLNLTKTVYHRTIIGDLFAQHIEEEHPIANNAMGFIMEYRVYEFLVRYKKDIYSEILHSEKLFGRELDLLMVHANSNDKSVGEVKSYNQTQYAFSDRSKGKNGNIKNLSTQIQAQFKEFQDNNFTPKEYHIYIHKQYYFDIFELTDNLKKLKEKVKRWSNGNTKFKAFYFNVDFKLKDRSFFKNPYAKIASQKLNNNAVKEINLN